ncbi:MAG: type II secretion system F family protein [Acidimicrobiia bacterium]
MALRPRRHRPGLGRRGRRLVVAAVAAVLVVPISPVLAPVVVAGAWGLDLRRRHGERHAIEAAVQESLPEAVDLLALAVGAGLTVPLAVAAVGRRGDGPVAAGLARVAGEVGQGRRCADALDDLPAELGEAVRPLVGVLAAAERYGAPLGQSLERLASEVRDQHRRRAEEAARRVPVKLLFPLVCCVLPAFALLTVVPMLAGAFGALRP